MSIYEVNRNTVNRRLAIRRAEREEAQREAQQEAAEAALLADINQHARTVRAEKAAAQEAQRREEERRAAEAMKRKQRAEREKNSCLYWYLYMAFTFIPLLIAAVLFAFHERGLCPFWLMVAAAIAGTAISIYNFFSLAYWIDRKAVKRFLAAFWRRFKAYMLTPYAQILL